MGRRSQYPPEALRELILTATQRIVEDQGFAAVSAREIAREIGYAPGTLYNMFDNLDGILLRVEARLLLELDEHLTKQMSGKPPAEAVKAFVNGYVAFAYNRPRVWELLQFHQPPLKTNPPDWYLARVDALINRLAHALSQHQRTTDAEEASRNARQVWVAVHGIVQVATTSKFGIIPMPAAIWMIESILAPVVNDATPPSTPGRDRRAGNATKRVRKGS